MPLQPVPVNFTFVCTDHDFSGPSSSFSTSFMNHSNQSSLSAIRFEVVKTQTFGTSHIYQQKSLLKAMKDGSSMFSIEVGINASMLIVVEQT